ncbi:transporter substrate-binding domain-containing protein [Salidesulfovibrio brasiliensis]|uniref:transporter substrate-binding domain-containing protein n=1 Tax=Salidesulfovibrio brasiliensis TaxID=221711 RepID=UPI0006CF24F4|nr:transporter substrate-binding domain-containing protein [Salidesulfovibrio brasiliensis]
MRFKVAFLTIAMVAWGVFLAPAIARSDSYLFKGDMNYPPYEYLDEDGDPAGFNVDIVRAISRVMGIDVTIELEAWRHVRKQIEERKVDGLTGMYYSKARSRLVNFTTPQIIVSHAILLTKTRRSRVSRI